MDFAGLPSLWSWPARYSAGLVQWRLWATMRWWWREAEREVRRICREARLTGAVPELDLVALAEVAMHAAMRLGGFSAKAECAMAARPAMLPRISLAAKPGTISWEMLPGETWEQFKQRVFTPLFDATFGLPTDFCNQYVAKRLPPIRGAGESLRRAVAEAIRAAQLRPMTDRELEAALQEAGRWPLARVRTQIRTETATLYNAGRFVYMNGDEMVEGYRYVATLDDRTTPLCRELNGKCIRKAEIRAVPPLHFNCRTILAPVMATRRAIFTPAHQLPAPGLPPYGDATYTGFGQPELLAETSPPAVPLPVGRQAGRRPSRRPPAKAFSTERLSEYDLERAWAWGSRLQRRTSEAGEPADVKARIEAWLDAELGADPDWQACRAFFGGARGFIAQWAATSGDDDPWSIAIQMAAQEEFGLKGVTMRHMSAERGRRAREQMTEAGWRGLRKALRAIYDRTQRDLEELGAEEVVLWRGAALRSNLEDGLHEVNVGLQPLSSFSTDPDVAWCFTHGTFGSRRGRRAALLCTRVPQERIFSTYRTGFGCLNEAEFVVLGARKGSNTARMGIGDAWLMRVENRLLEVFGK